MKNAIAQMILDASGNKFVSITFIKKNGAERKINGRFRCQVDTVGGINTTKHKENLITIRDVHARAYRNINVESIQRIAVAGKVYSIGGV